MPKSNKRKLIEYGPIHEQHLRSGVKFVIKYCGSQLIEDIRKGQLFSSATVSAAIHNLLDFNRKAKRKSQVAVLTVSTGGINLLRNTDNESLVSSSIERIAYCTADKRTPRIFGFVARNCVNETVELHVCKCADTKEPVQLAYALNQAFTVAASDLADSDAALRVDEQPAAWCDAQALSLARTDAAEEQQHGDWVQFS